jgi:hypothetical protein
MHLAAGSDGNDPGSGIFDLIEYRSDTEYNPFPPVRWPLLRPTEVGHLLVVLSGMEGYDVAVKIR